MATADRDPRVLHLYDCADVGATLVRAGRADGRKWTYLAARDVTKDAGGVAGNLHRTADIVTWTAQRWMRSARADLIHVHFGTRVEIVRRWPRRRFVVHFHGTDIREFYKDPVQRCRIQWGADNAEAVLYATPDLAEYALNARPDARYLPNPVDLAELPDWQPGSVPRIVFASRWSAAKGGEDQMVLAGSLVAATAGTGIELQGLDWGENAARAAALGVTLVPPKSKPGYLEWLAGAHAVVGQSTGLLGMSELQAMAIGVPTASNVRPGLYPGTVPVIGSGSVTDQTDAIIAAAADSTAASAALDARRWVVKHHDPRSIARELAAVYSVIGQRIS